MGGESVVVEEEEEVSGGDWEAGFELLVDYAELVVDLEQLPSLLEHAVHLPLRAVASDVLKDRLHAEGHLALAPDHVQTLFVFEVDAGPLFVPNQLPRTVQPTTLFQL